MSNLVEQLPPFPLEELASWANIAIVADKQSRRAMREKLCLYFRQTEDAEIHEKTGQSVYEWRGTLQKALEMEERQAETRSSIILCPGALSYAAAFGLYPQEIYREALESSLGTIICKDCIVDLSCNSWRDYPQPYDLIFFKGGVSQAKQLWHALLRRLLSADLCVKLVTEADKQPQNWIVVQVSFNSVNLFRVSLSDLEVKAEENPTTESSWFSGFKFW